MDSYYKSIKHDKLLWVLNVYIYYTLHLLLQFSSCTNIFEMYPFKKDTLSQ